MRHVRPIPLFLSGLVAFAAAVAALALTGGPEARAHDSAGHAASAGSVSAAELRLRSDMRRLWDDHVTWTRLAIISLTTAAPDTEATVARLLRNQADIGNAVKPFYGKAAGAELTRQLRAHILIAADLVAAAKAGDQAKLADAQARWQQNADGLAKLLSSVNPRNWPEPVLRRELRTHLRLTTDEAVARLQGAWTRDVVTYDRIHRHALHVADLLSGGLVAQFPARFR